MVEGTPAGIEIRHLRAFASVARLASFTHAAQELAITQPALSRTVRQLEELLRVTLPDRSSRHVELTDAGQAFLEHAQRVLAELDRGVSAARSRGTVKLGFSWLLPTPWAQETVARFEHTTGSSVDLVRIDDPLAAVQQEKVDVALVRGQVRSPQLQVVHLFDEDRVAVFAETFPHSGASELAWADVPNWPLVVNVVNGTTGPGSWPEGQGPTTVLETANFDVDRERRRGARAGGGAGGRGAAQHPPHGAVPPDHRCARDPGRVGVPVERERTGASAVRGSGARVRKVVR
ncbi:LysR family transcriptional regulator [Amycolatopsis carbonis]|uniref:LysR family transcriptional regulator n=1 Tax=Amycolatopsis carbonis TaxID=715471 RepID=A0A9Y2I826_9PSEU|nr:LysR family transcriptional regulator [Amycolatopsis sp. 2-15]WIX75044.1 LysR family transcriptional regulator [Amycolatopsis sp. 2-15]